MYPTIRTPAARMSSEDSVVPIGRISGVFPNEVLLQIVEESADKTFMTFGACCKSLYELQLEGHGRSNIRMRAALVNALFTPWPASAFRWSKEFGNSMRRDSKICFIVGATLHKNKAIARSAHEIRQIEKWHESTLKRWAERITKPVEVLKKRGEITPDELPPHLDLSKDRLRELSISVEREFADWYQTAEDLALSPPPPKKR